MTTALLHHFKISHFNEKVRWTLDYKKWPHRRNAIMPGLHLGTAKKLSKQTKLPILELDGEVLVGSSQIIAELERRRPEPVLFPASEADRARARALEAHFDDHVAPPLRTLFWWAYIESPSHCVRMVTEDQGAHLKVGFRALFPVLRAKFSDNIGLDDHRVRAAREGLVGYFDRVAREVQSSGYLVGDRFTVADLAVASIMSAIVRPPEFPYRLPEPRPPKLLEIQATVRSHPAFAWVEGIYARHRGSSAEVS